MLPKMAMTKRSIIIFTSPLSDAPLGWSWIPAAPGISFAVDIQSSSGFYDFKVELFFT